MGVCLRHQQRNAARHHHHAHRRPALMLRIAVSLLFTVSLAAQEARITLDPPGPTSLTPIEAHVFVVCRTESFTVNRVGNVVKIHIVPGSSDLCDPPFYNVTPVTIGTLPVGEYRIEVTVGELDSIAASRTFIVRDTVKRDVEIHPFAVPTQPFGLRLRLDAGDLGVAKVFVDDVQVTDLTVNGAYWFPAPAHARGFADVRIETTLGTTHTVPNAIYYYDHVAPLDTSVFERILFPVLFHSSGAHGSEWVSEAAIANTKHWFIETFNDVVPFECIDYPC